LATGKGGNHLKSDDITVQQLFQDRRQYMVPFYQRAYVWTRSGQWEQLWDDIREKAEARLIGSKNGPHFLGAVVLDPQPRDGLIGVDTLHIIDGQQRLATLQFILKSVLLLLRAVNSTAIAEIVAGSLKNSNPDTMRNPEIEIFKVWPTFRDRDDYRSALEAKDRDALRAVFPKSFTQRDEFRRIGIHHPAALEAIWFFTGCFEKWIAEGTHEERSTRCETLATSILQDLKIVSIVLDDNDDAQVIFETLNGRGAQLHSTDLIRNFIFMRADRENKDSKTLYDTLWQKFEQSYWNEEQKRGRLRKPRLEWFIHAALQAELSEEIDLGRLYFEYRRYVFSDLEPKTAEHQLNVLSKYAIPYRALVDGNMDSSPISRFGWRIAPFDITTLQPLALKIGIESLSPDEQAEMFDTIVSYIVRRAICGLTPKNYNNIFISILRSLSKTGTSLLTLRKSFESLKGEASRWPTDSEFRNACINAPLYPGRLDASKMRAILTELELELRKTVRTEGLIVQNFGQLDIDHIMPQSWFEHWPLPDTSNATWSDNYSVEIKKLAGHQLNERETAILTRQVRIPTLGNLTMLNLSVNREAQHKAFKTKRDLLLANTTLRLNIPLLGYQDDGWTEETTKSRGELLADVALRVWPGPQPTSLS
jgi:hypothetical protein